MVAFTFLGSTEGPAELLELARNVADTHVPDLEARRRRKTSPRRSAAESRAVFMGIRQIASARIAWERSHVAGRRQAALPGRIPRAQDARSVQALYALLSGSDRGSRRKPAASAGLLPEAGAVMDQQDGPSRSMSDLLHGLPVLNGENSSPPGYAGG